MRLVKLFLLTLSLLVAPSASFRAIHAQRGIGGLVAVAASRDNIAETKKKNPIFQMLSTPRDSKPGRSNFFYNDEVTSHLHGYMFLIGSIAANDEVRRTVAVVN